MLCRFYGWTHQEIMQLSLKQLIAYTEAINETRNAELMPWLNIISFPHATKSSQKKIADSLKEKRIININEIEGVFSR